MKMGLKKGAGILDAVLILAFVLFVIIVTPKNSTSSNNWLSGPNIFGSTPTFPSSSNSGNITSGTITSRASDTYSISLSSGNAPYESESFKEYVELQNWGNASVDITGWVLKNGKDQRTYYQGSNLQQFSADIATIPQAYKPLYPNGGSAPQDVVLKPGERAIITTGSLGVRSPVDVKSFKENMCTGYIQGLEGYTFSPPLDATCFNPAKEPGIESLDRDCRDFISTMPSCKTPRFDTRQANGDTCTTCINGVYLSSQCAAFIKQHFSYQGCLAYHASDADFNNKNTWRIFLNRAWEMWSDKYETINIFDRLGNLVGSQKY